MLEVAAMAAVVVVEMAAAVMRSKAAGFLPTCSRSLGGESRDGSRVGTAVTITAKAVAAVMVVAVAGRSRTGGGYAALRALRARAMQQPRPCCVFFPRSRVA